RAIAATRTKPTTKACWARGSREGVHRSRSQEKPGQGHWRRGRLAAARVRACSGGWVRGPLAHRGGPRTGRAGPALIFGGLPAAVDGDHPSLALLAPYFLQEDDGATIPGVLGSHPGP